MKVIYLILFLILNINAENCKYYLIKEKTHQKLYKLINQKIKKCDKNSSINIISKNKKIKNKKEKLWWLYGKKRQCYIKIDENYLINIDKEINNYKTKNKCKKMIMGIFEKDKLKIIK